MRSSADIGQTRLKTVPGVFAVVGGPLADRIGHMLSGVSRSGGGEDLRAGPGGGCARLGDRDPGHLPKPSPASRTAKLDQTIRRSRSSASRRIAIVPAAYGIAPGHLNEQLSALIGGKETHPAPRWPAICESGHCDCLSNGAARPEKHLGRCPIEMGTPASACRFRSWPMCARPKGPNVIFREDSQRRFALAIKPTVAGRFGTLVGTSASREVARKGETARGLLPQV